MVNAAFLADSSFAGALYNPLFGTDAILASITYV